MFDGLYHPFMVILGMVFHTHHLHRPTWSARNEMPTSSSRWSTWPNPHPKAEKTHENRGDQQDVA